MKLFETSLRAIIIYYNRLNMFEPQGRIRKTGPTELVFQSWKTRLVLLLGVKERFACKEVKHVEAKLGTSWAGPI